jgi:hypothetical protein
MVLAAKKVDSSIELWKDVSRELWEVQLLEGGSRLMTVDELDVAYRSDEIHPRTLVRRQGARAWVSLREAARLDEPSYPESAIVPISSEVEIVSERPLSKPPPLPSKRVSTAAVRATVPAEDSVSLSTRESGAVPVQNGMSLRESMFPKAAPIPGFLGTEELAVARPRSVMGKLAAVAAVALIGGGLFAAMSAKLAGSFKQAETHTAMTANVPAQPAAPNAQPANAPIANAPAPNAQGPATETNAPAANAPAAQANAHVATTPPPAAQAKVDAHAASTEGASVQGSAHASIGGSLGPAHPPALGHDKGDSKGWSGSKKAKSAPPKHHPFGKAKPKAWHASAKHH